jgi:hypothetical protein
MQQELIANGNGRQLGIVPIFTRFDQLVHLILRIALDIDANNHLSSPLEII